MKNLKSKRSIGVTLSLSAGILWGMMPLYINLVDAADPYEIIAQRSLWSAVLLFVICWMRGHLGDIWMMIKGRRHLINFSITTFFLLLNWSMYVYAVQTEQVVAAALGYFIYPLCTVMLGILVLNERLTAWAWIAIGFVGFGVLTKALMMTNVPWVSLALAGSFSLYAVLRKRMNFDPLQGLFIETLALFPFAIAFLIWMKADGQVLFFGGGTANVCLALLAGVVTVLPLVLFLKGNSLLNMTSASLLFYSNPTAHLFLGVFVFAEPFVAFDLIPFGMIWAGIAVYFFTVGKAINTTKSLA